MTMVGLAGPAPGSHSPSSPLPQAFAQPASSDIAAPSPVEAAAEPKPRAPIGLAAARGAKQTLLGGLHAPKFEPPPVPAPQNNPSPRSTPDPSASGTALDAWTVALADGTQREANTSELKELLRNKIISEENLVWHESMSDWSALGSLPALRKAVTGQASSAPAPPPESEPITQTAPQPAGSNSRDGMWSEPGSWSAPDAKTGTESSEALGHLSDEISRALSSSVAEAEPLSREASAAGSVRAPQAAVDASPASARPQSAAPLPLKQPRESDRARAADVLPFAIASSSRTPLWPFLLLVVVLVLVVGTVAVLRTGSPPPAFALLQQILPESLRRSLGEAPPPPAVMPTREPSAEPTPAEARPTPQDLSALDAASATASNAAASNAAASDAAPATPPASGEKTPPARNDPPTDKPAKTERDERDKPASRDKASFDENAAKATLARLAGGIQKCRGAEPAGSGQVRVTFGPSGEATAASVAGQYAASDAGLCVLDIFRVAKVQPFGGESVTVVHNFKLQ